LASSYAINEAGDWMALIALPVLVFDQTDSALAIAALFIGMRFLPALLTPVLVARIERVQPRLSLAAIYFAEAAAFGVLALLADHFSLVGVIAVGILDGTLALAGRSLTRAVTAAMLEPSGELRSGNAILNFSFTGSAAVGPAVAGLVVAGFGVQSALLLDACSFFLIAILMAVGPLPMAELEEGRWKDRFRAGLAYIANREPLRRLLMAQGVAILFFSLVIPIAVVYAKSTLGAGDAGYGALVASWGFGMVMGSLVFASFRRTGFPRLLLYSTIAIGAAYLATAAAPTLLVACGASVVGGLGNGIQWVSVVSAIQELTRSSMQARVMSVLESVAAAMPGLGFLVGGLVVEDHSPRTAFLVAGLGVFVVTAFATRSLAGTPWSRGEGAIGPSGLDENLDSDMLKIEDPAGSLTHTGGSPVSQEEKRQR
jgi:MFS family permease